MHVRIASLFYFTLESVDGWVGKAGKAKHASMAVSYLHVPMYVRYGDSGEGGAAVDGWRMCAR